MTCSTSGRVACSPSIRDDCVSTNPIMLADRVAGVGTPGDVPWGGPRFTRDSGSSQDSRECGHGGILADRYQESALADPVRIVET
jgi:hypothetical protein